MNDNLIRDARRVLSENQKIIITAHKRPDGDAVGSLLGLGLALKHAGKEVQLVLQDGVPSSFHHLAGSEQIKRKSDSDFEVSIVLDCSDLDRVGNVFQSDEVPTINIDHHITNLNYGEINLVYPQIPATAEILAGLIPELGFVITLESAEALLTGIITDTLGFRTNNMTPNTLRVAADLVEMGCDLPELYQKALLNRTYNSIRYWGAGINNLNLDDGLLWTALTIEDRNKIGYPGRDDGDLINVMSSIRDVDIALIFVEQTNGTVKISWRSHTGYDVSKIAFSFGGGGHKPASGAEIEGDLEDIQHQVLEATRKHLLNHR
jgi:bifunctional oligoribonuclease and PAP phosphatase NrnA